MAILPDYSIGFTQTEVEEILTELKKELKKTISQYSDAGTQVIRQKTEDIHSKIATCQRALQKMDPDQYGSLHKTSASRVHPTLAR